MALAQLEVYTEEDYYTLPEDVRAELIGGQIYYMAAPGRIHQEILSFLHVRIANYINSRKGSCRIYPAPFAVKLFADDDKTIVEPDISVICDKNKLTDRGCTGAPDWIIEIVSPSSKYMDYVRKLIMYQNTGVREYWLVDPGRRWVTVYGFERKEGPEQYSFSDKVKAGIYEEFWIDFSEYIFRDFNTNG